MGESTSDSLQVEHGKSTPQSPKAPPSRILAQAHHSATHDSLQRHAQDDTISLARLLIENQTGRLWVHVKE